MNPITRESLFDITFLSEIKAAPGGKHAAFVATKGSATENKYESHIWLHNLHTGDCIKLAAAGEEKNFQWLDSDHIIFPATRTEKEREKIKKGIPVTFFYTININGGEATRAFKIPAKVSQLKPHDGKYIALASFDNNQPNVSEMEDPEKYFKEQAEADAAYKIFDEIPFWQNGAGVTNKKRRRLYIFDPTTDDFTPISPPLMNVSSFDTDENHLVFCGAEFDSVMVQDSQIFSYEFATAKLDKIELDGVYSINFAKILGENFIFHGRTGEAINSYANATLYTVSKNGGAPKIYQKGDFSIGSSVGSDCKFGGGSSTKIYGGGLQYISTRNYSSYLYVSKNGVETQLSADTTGSIDCFDTTAEKIIYIAVRNKGLQELYQLDPTTGTETQITNFNSQWISDYNVSYPQHFTFINRDGVELDGFVILPTNFDPAQKYPAILDIHGGPKVVYGDIIYHEMQLWANAGYFVFFTNPRGSDGRGTEFANCVGERYMNWDYNDFMDFTDAVLERHSQIDAARLGVTGGSYGGLMANWIVGHTDKFAAAASQRSITNFISKCLTTDIGYYHNLNQMGTDPWTNHDVFWEKSPLKYADKVKTPVLFLHSDQDYRCYMADAFQMFTALKMFGVDTRLCLFHGENHELSRSGKPKNRLKRLGEITDWFERYLK